MAMATSKDVARIAGVSRATVSRVLSGSSRISGATRERVTAAAQSVGYEPNVVAQSLVRQRSHTIALSIFSDGKNPLLLGGGPFYFDVLESIQHEADARGYDLLLPSRIYTDLPAYVRGLTTRHVAGALMVALRTTDPRINALVSAAIPTVFVDVVAEGLQATYVTSDNIGGARQATDHLLHLGHRRIATISGYATSLAGTERLLGYQQALAHAGLAVDPGLVRPSGFGMEDAYAATVTLLNERRDVTAIVAASDLMAVGVLRALHERALRVPHDVSLVGFDDIDLCLYVDPPLTTIRQDRAAMGRGAVRCLIDNLIGGVHAITPVVVPTQLVVRGTTGPVT